MPVPFSRAALSGGLLAALLALPVPAAAKEGGEAVSGTVPAKTEAATGKDAAASGAPSMSWKGGTAIINFVAPVSSKTMADLAQQAQNAVIGGADSVRVNISSRGGSLHAIQFGVNLLKTLPVPVETVAMSQIASAAVALYCAGERRYMADGAALYLHQQRGFEEIQVKTASAVVRELELSTQWYDDLLRDCAAEDADRSALDYSARDVVIDVEQATALGMVTGPLDPMDHKDVWGSAMNVVAPDSPSGGGYPYPSYR